MLRVGVMLNLANKGIEIRMNRGFATGTSVSTIGLRVKWAADDTNSYKSVLDLTDE